VLAGAWAIHIVLILLCKIIYDIIPGVSQETSWTLTNITYMFGSYIMFHYVRGVPFDFNSGAYDNLNMWEQIDDGAQYTPAKKFLLTVPIMLFLLSTHYTHYDMTYFTINFLALLGVIIPKLPFVSSATSYHFVAPNHGHKTDSPHRVIGCVLVYFRESPRTKCMDRVLAFVVFAFGNAGGCEVWSASITLGEPIALDEGRK
jgi:hypothetical protein